MSEIVASLHPLVRDILAARGLTKEEDIDTFISGEYIAGLHDPFLLNDMKKAVLRIEEAMDKDEHIVIYSDYDCDGIPGAVVLYDFFTTIGYKNFSNYIPHRHFEGFGFNVSSLAELQKRKANLVITVDCGTSDYEAVAAAAASGIDTIITDHHEPKENLPKSLAIINPKIGDSYPFKELCGAGVVFKLTQALLSHREYKLTEGKEKWWLDMVGIATIADMVPLVDENRIFARFGLTVLRKSRRPGLLELLRKQKANQSFLTEDDIGFTIGPRLNAASRMDAPEDAFNLLATSDDVEAVTLASHLEKLNNERKGVVAAMTREAHKTLKQYETLPDILVLGSPEWRPALVGLVAGKLAEEHNRPTFVWGRDGNGILKGSVRSNGVISIITLMEKAKDLFIEYGGHHFSGGFSLADESVHTFRDKLNAAFAELGDEVVCKEELVADLELDIKTLDKKFVDSLFRLAPFGVGNPKPLFLFKNIEPLTVAAFGKNQEHTKLTFESSLGKISAISFFNTPEFYGLTANETKRINLLANLEQSFFMGRRETRLRIVDIT